MSGALRGKVGLEHGLCEVVSLGVRGLKMCSFRSAGGVDDRIRLEIIDTGARFSNSSACSGSSIGIFGPRESSGSRGAFFPVRRPSGFRNDKRTELVVLRLKYFLPCLNSLSEFPVVCRL